MCYRYALFTEVSASSTIIYEKMIDTVFLAPLQKGMTVDVLFKNGGSCRLEVAAINYNMRSGKYSALLTVPQQNLHNSPHIANDILRYILNDKEWHSWERSHAPEYFPGNK